MNLKRKHKQFSITENVQDEVGQTGQNQMESRLFNELGTNQYENNFLSSFPDGSESSCQSLIQEDLSCYDFEHKLCLDFQDQLVSQSNLKSLKCATKTGSINSSHALEFFNIQSSLPIKKLQSFQEDQDEFPMSQFEQEKDMVQEQQIQTKQKLLVGSNARGTRKNQTLFENRGLGQQRKDKLRKQARKNYLPYFSRQLSIYAEKYSQKYCLNEKELGLLEEIKKSATRLSFDELFQQGGNLKIMLVDFFQPRGLWKIVISSKSQSFISKLQFKKISRVLTKGLILGHISGKSKK